MTHETTSTNRYRETTIRIPATMTKPHLRGSPWSAEVNPGPGTHTRWKATGTTQAEAAANLTQLVLAGLEAANEQPVVVVGGGPGYQTCIHLVFTTEHGHDVYVIRDGRPYSTWSGRDQSMKDAVNTVLRHVGGDPAVIHL